MDSDQSTYNSNNLTNYRAIQELWESKSDFSPKKVLAKAKKCLKKMPALVGKGPFTAVIFDLHTSRLKGCIGAFKEVLGHDYKEDMLMAELIPALHPDHNVLVAQHFPTYINHIVSLKPAKRKRIDLSVIFKYKRGDTYYWLSFRAYKYFSDSAHNLGYVILEYTDITNIKNDKWAKFIVYDKKAGYIVNAVVHPNTNCFESLTPTELAITKLIANGLSDKEIAVEQDSALDTIKHHKKHIFSKLGINKSTELVALAYACGLVS